MDEIREAAAREGPLCREDDPAMRQYRRAITISSTASFTKDGKIRRYRWPNLEGLDEMVGTEINSTVEKLLNHAHRWRT